ncbi:MAG: TlpA family protein disulfide reductase [Chitinophagaceae bacterium]|nr:TlpA family protein disulfide reductase [Chitinophagaceae bacterium]
MAMDKKKLKSRIINFIFFGTLFVLLVSTPARSWLLRQVLSTGLLNATIKKEAVADSSIVMPLTFEDLSGFTASTHELRDKIVFINFWASWCPPCRAEMPAIDNLIKKMRGDTDIVFLMINLDEEPEAGTKYLRENFPDLPFFRAKGMIPNDMFSGTLPTTIVLDKRGSIVMRHTGMANYDSKKFIEQLESLK